MQHSSALELKAGGWHWVDSHTSDCRVRGCPPHPTKEDAEGCQWEAELATASGFESTSARECVECKAGGTPKVWTDGGLRLGGYMGRHVYLCDAHRTVDVLRKHTTPPTERWQS